MAPQEKTVEPFQELCGKIRAAIHPSISFSWDERFRVSLVTLTRGQSQDVYSIMLKEFAENWVSESIVKAPQLVQFLADQILGIRHGQLLFTMNPSSMIVLFAAWWPWENNETISLRIGLRPIEGSAVTEQEMTVSLKKWLQIP